MSGQHHLFAYLKLWELYEQEKSCSMLTVIIDTSPLSSGHAARGIGTYTRLLTAALDEIEDIKIIRSSTLKRGESQGRCHTLSFF